MKPRLLLLIPTSTYRAEAFVRAARRLAVDLSIASEMPSSLAHLHPVDLPSFDFGDPAAAAAKARSVLRDTHVTAVVPVDDRAVPAAAAIAAELGVPHVDLSAAIATRNKFLARERLHAAGVAVPRYTLLPLSFSLQDLERQVVRDVGYPAVIKPLSLSASRGVLRVDNASQFYEALPRVAAIARTEPTLADPLPRGHVLAEAFVPGWEVAVEGLVTNGHLDILAIFDKPDPLEGPVFPETIYVTPSRLPANVLRQVEAVARDAVSAVGVAHGPVHVELRGSDRAVVPVEVHARSIGGLCSRVLRFTDGRTLEDVILEHALGLLGETPRREALASGVWMMQAPRIGRFLEMHGVNAASAVAGVDEVIVSARPGQELAPLPDGFLYIGFIFARASTPEQVVAALRAAHDRLDPVIDDISAEAPA